MELNEYQKKAKETAFGNFTLYVLGVCGESGELANKWKKIVRDQDGKTTNEQRHELNSEIGDILWYVSMLASNHDFRLENKAIHNISKLEDRKKRGQLRGNGDNR